MTGPLRILLGSAVLLAGVMVAATAQAPGDTTRLGDLVITAARVPVPTSAIAGATTVISGDDLRARGVQLVLDALRDVPGVMIVQAGSYGAQASLFLRGGASDYVKVLLDGVPLNLPGGNVNFADLTTADLDRIEIVRGPASVLYGADAMSGVVQLFTRHATAMPTVELAGRDGTFRRSDLNGHLSLLDRGWSLSATGSRQASDGTYAFNSGWTNTVGSLRLGLDQGSAGRAAFTFRYGDGVAHFPTDGSGALVDHNQFTTETSLAMGLDLSWGLDSADALAIHGDAARAKQGYTNRSDTPADTIGFDFVDDAGSRTWRRGIDARLDRHVGGGALLSIGAGLESESDVERDAGLSNFGTGVSADTSALTGDRTTRDAYLQLLSPPGASVASQLGVRLDDNSAFGSFTTWRVGFTWHTGTEARAWVAAGTAFKAPTFPELFARSAYEVGNPALTPERSGSREVGLELKPAGQQLTLTLTAYWQQFRDLIQYVAAAPGEPTYVNLGGADANGVEASLVVRAGSAVTVGARWTWLHTTVTDTGAAASVAFQQGAALIRRPGSNGGATVTYRARGLVLAGVVTRIGSRDDIDDSGPAAVRVILPAYTTLDLSLDAPIVQATGRSFGLDLTLRGENLFNAAYQQTVGFPGRGRTLLAGVRTRF